MDVEHSFDSVETDMDSGDEQVIMLSQRNKRKRKIAAAIAAAVVCNPAPLLLAMEGKAFSVIGRKINVKRQRDPVTKEILLLAEESPQLFKRMYRLDREDFFNIIAKIHPKLQENTKHTSCPISSEIYLAIALRWLAGGCYWDIGFGYKLPYGSVHGYVFKVLSLIDKSVNNIKFPIDDVSELRKIEAKFAALTDDNFKGTVAAGDGIVFPIDKPSASEVNGDVSSFFTRKGYYAFGLQAFCDATCKFLSICSRICSSSHDSTSYLMTQLKKLIDEGQLPKIFHIVLDEAYVCTEQELSPWKGRELDFDKDSFNYLLSKQRQCIERAFGILVQRWGIFWRPMRVKMKKIPQASTDNLKSYMLSKISSHLQTTLQTIPSLL